MHTGCRFHDTSQAVLDLHNFSGVNVSLPSTQVPSSPQPCPTIPSSYLSFYSYTFPPFSHLSPSPIFSSLLYTPPSSTLFHPFHNPARNLRSAVSPHRGPGRWPGRWSISVHFQLKILLLWMVTVGLPVFARYSEQTCHYRLPLNHFICTHQWPTTDHVTLASQ